MVGALNDGYNSVARYFINNFGDGYNVDCLDLATNKLNPQRTISHPSMSPIKQAGIALIVLTCIINWWLNGTFPKSEESGFKESLFYFIAHFFVIAIGFLVI